MLYRLAQMGGLDVVRIRQIGDRSGHAQHPMACPGREMQALDGGAQQALVGGSEATVAFHVLRPEVLIGAVAALQLPMPGAFDTGAYRGAFLTFEGR